MLGTYSFASATSGILDWIGSDVLPVVLAVAGSIIALQIGWAIVIRFAGPRPRR